MLTQAQIIDTLGKKMPYLREKYHVRRIGLFGSYAKGNYNNKSDIDLVVELNPKIGLEFISLCEYFEKLFDKKVDVLTAAGIQSIRVKRVAEDIMKNIIYVLP